MDLERRRNPIPGYGGLLGDAGPEALGPGFPPTEAQPGAVGRPGYSPLVRVVFRHHLVVLNAPQIANATGQADKIVSFGHGTVTYRETDGCYDNESVHYA